jgi:hypothetical protein
MPPVGFEPTISAGEGLQTYSLDRADSQQHIFVINLKSILSPGLRKKGVDIQLEILGLD